MVTDDVDVVTEEESGDDSQFDNGIESVAGEIEQTEDGRQPQLIEEAKNTPEAPQIEEEVKQTQGE